MKILKYSFMVLTMAIITSVSLCYAEDIYSKYGVYEIPVGKSIDNEPVEKNRFGEQSFYNEKTFTGLTNPCKDCKIRVTLKRKSSSGKWEDLAYLNSYMGTKEYFLESITQAPGNYRLSFKRVGITALPTHVAWEWQFQPPLA